nr:FRG domain-containing protein [uncultured Porphyromonas sp.]
MSQGIESNSTNAATSPSMQVEEVRINSVSEFIEKIVQLDKEEGTEIFYRGHADRDWELLPSIFRMPNGVEKEHLFFRDMVAHEPQSFSECKSTLDYLVQMQHYGLPTRLLDMTTNPLVALYFACQPTPDDAVAGAVAGAQAGIQVLDKALRVCVAISQTLSQVEADAANETVARNIAQAIVGAIAVVDVGAVEQAITQVIDTAVIAEDAQDSFLEVKKVIAQAIVEAATVAGTQEATNMMVMVAALFVAVDNSKLGFDEKLFSRAGAVAGAIAGISAEAGQIAVAVAMAAEGINTIVPEQLVECPVEFTALVSAKAGAELGSALGAKARAKDGAVYLFSIPEDKVKHYDSDTVSVLTNLAKCKISEQCSSCLSVEDFNEQPDIKFLLHQIKGEKPHFLPLIQPCDLNSLFFVKAKNGNQRIANQMGAFLLFGLGVKQAKASGSDGEVNLLTKSEHTEVPTEWIKKKLIIQKECKADILKELALLGITESYIYPGIEQYAKELKKKYKL